VCIYLCPHEILYAQLRCFSRFRRPANSDPLPILVHVSCGKISIRIPVSRRVLWQDLYPYSCVPSCLVARSLSVFVCPVVSCGKITIRIPVSRRSTLFTDLAECCCWRFATDSLVPGFPISESVYVFNWSAFLTYMLAG
jgi:hypothetical protein